MNCKRAVWVILLPVALVVGQAAGADKPKAAPTAPAASGTPNRAQAYYHYSLGHLYEELAGAYNRQEYFTKAIEHYKLAMQYDPGSAHLSAELAALYAHTGRIREAIEEGEEVLRRDPKNLEARRLLGRIYVRALGEGMQGSAVRSSQTDLLRRAIEQYEKLVELDPKNFESHLVLGRLYRVNNDLAKSEAALKKALALQPESEETLLALAALYSDSGDSHSAVDLLERITQKNSSPRLLAMLGQTYEQARDYPKAIEAFKRALEQDKNNLDLARALGQNLLYNEQYDEALKQFQALADSEPQDGTVFLRLGQIYRQKRQYDLALENLKKAQALAPDSLEVPYNLALLAEGQGRPEEAITLLKKLLNDTAKPSGAEYTAREKTNRSIFMERLGFLYRSQENFAAAEEYFRKMGEMDQESAVRGASHLIETLRQAREYQRAREETDAVVKRFPQDPTLKMMRAALIADLGRLDEGVAELKAMLPAERAAASPKENEREVWITLAQVYERARRFPEALQAVMQAERLSHRKEEKEFIYFLWGSILERQKKSDEAEQQFRKALAINPDSAMTLNYLGYMLADRGVRLDESVKFISRALEIDPGNGAYLDSLGWAYFKQNRLDLAEQYLLKAVQRISRDSTIRDHLGDLYFKTGRIREALLEWQAALREWQRLLPAETDPEEIAKVQKKLENGKIRLARETGVVKN